MLSAKDVAFYGIVFGTVLLNVANAYAALNAAPSCSFSTKRFSEMVAGAAFLIMVSALIYWEWIW
ncbi:MAG: hypothetical protein LVQ97_03275 [Candidatus Micrarchaeales archaeon]|nr:hypothetical protein [Candidatus Micrarchaeales archaeon]